MNFTLYKFSFEELHPLGILPPSLGISIPMNFTLYKFSFAEMHPLGILPSSGQEFYHPGILPSRNFYPKEFYPLGISIPMNFTLKEFYLLGISILYGILPSINFPLRKCTL